MTIQKSKLILNLATLLAGVFLFSSTAIAGAIINPKILPPTAINDQTKSNSLPINNAQLPVPHITPHRAYYDVTLVKNHSEEISDVRGVLTIQIRDVDDSWAVEQTSKLRIIDVEGVEHSVTMTSASLEQKDGLQYQFNCSTIRNGVMDENMRGNALMATKNGEGVATYQSPQAINVKLPIGTLFPLNHLLKMLTAASAGQTVFSSTVFDGTNEAQTPVDVDAILSSSHAEINNNNQQLLHTEKSWNIQMAVFSLESKGPEPDYQVTLTSLASGVMTKLILDYGTFQAQALLNKVEIFTNSPKSTH